MNTMVVPCVFWMRSSRLMIGSLHRDVERRDRLVGHQDIGLGREGAGDRDALLLAAGQPAAAAARRRSGDSRTISNSSATRRSVCLAGPWCMPNLLQHAGDRIAGAVRWVEGGVGVLEHHLHRARPAWRCAALVPSLARSSPITTSLPPLAGCSPASTRAKVDLPEPDSPTMASDLAGLGRRSSGPRWRPACGRTRRRTATCRRRRSWSRCSAATTTASLGGSGSMTSCGVPGEELVLLLAHAAHRRWSPAARRSAAGSAGSHSPAANPVQRGPKQQPCGRACSAAGWPGIGRNGVVCLSESEARHAGHQAGAYRGGAGWRRCRAPAPARPVRRDTCTPTRSHTLATDADDCG